VEHLDKFAAELKGRTDFYLQKLYEKLLKPLMGFIQDRNLIIVPVSVLHYVPFQALFDGENYVVENREVVFSPSSTIWKTLDKRPLRKLKNVLLMGFADEKIPLVNDEIKQLKAIFQNSKSFVGKSANFSNYTRNAEDFDVLHLACHGQFRPDNPLFSSLHLANGFVTVRDICSQKLNAELVTLSACETGLNKIFAGDEILGLARGFLTAGVNSLILSLWTVNDKATGELIKIFYTELQRGNAVSASLRKAQKNFIAQGKHPYFWSPFAIIGR
jgi:CHAT domain-containing protein